MDSPKNEQPQTSVELPITPPPAIKKPNSPGKVISIVALLITLATAGAIFFIWQQLKHHQEQYNQQINHLEINLSHANELLNQQEQALAASQKQFQSLLDEQNAQKQGGYVLLEVKYLVRLAEFHLMFENNALLARQLLETADQRVATDKTSALWPLRQAFAQDIAMLDATPTVDLPGLVARLQTVSQQAEELPQTPITLAEKEVASAQTAEVTTSAEGEHTKTVHLFLDKLKKFTYAVGNTLSTMVIVSKDSKSIPTLLTTAERIYVVTNIQSQLTLAEWAVVHRQADIYQQSLLQVDNWLQHYFSIDSPLVQSMLKTTDALKKVSVNPATPIISRSIDALAQLKLNP